MRAIVIDGFGGPEVLRLADIAEPVAGPGEVVIQVAYAGVNPVDWKAREGWLSQFFEYKFPFVPGFAGAGIISQVGPDVADYKVGDRVVTNSDQSIGKNGTYAEFVKTSANRAAHLADHVDFQEGASIPTAAVTAWLATFNSGGLSAGQSVLVNGGAGGTGSFAIQFAKYAGARVATTCSPGNIDYVTRLGADLAIDYRANDVADAVLGWAPEGVDLIVDTVGQGTLKDGIRMVKAGGKIATIGTLIKDEPAWDMDQAQQKNVEIIKTMSAYNRAGETLRTIVKLYNEGHFQPPAIEVLPLAEAAEAHRRIQGGHVRGKLLLKVSEL